QVGAVVVLVAGGAGVRADVFRVGAGVEVARRAEGRDGELRRRGRLDRGGLAAAAVEPEPDRGRRDRAGAEEAEQEDDAAGAHDGPHFGQNRAYPSFLTLMRYSDLPA